MLHVLFIYLFIIIIVVVVVIIVIITISNYLSLLLHIINYLPLQDLLSAVLKVYPASQVQ